MLNKPISLEEYEDYDCGLAVKLEKSMYPCRTYRSNQGGSVLIGLIIVMVIFSILSLSLLPMFSTSTLHQVRADQALRAHYLAESGYRYAASEFLHGGTGEDRDEVLSNIHNKEYVFNGNKSAFELEIGAYFYKYGEMDGVTLKTELFGGVPETIPTNGSGVSGTLAVFNDPTFYHTFNGYSIETGASGPELHFKITGGTSPAGTRVFPAVKGESSGAQVLSEGNDVSFEGDGDLFPLRFGAFRIYDVNGNEKYGEIYAYDKLDLNTNQLIGIKDLLNPDTTFSITIDTDDYIVLQRFLQFTSTGKFGDLNGSYATKTLVYSVPLEAIKTLGTGGIIELTGDELLRDLAENDAKGTALGQFEMKDVGGDEALAVFKATGEGGGAQRVEAIVGSPERDPNPLYLSWSDAGHFLSYDAQIKVAEGVPDASGQFSDKPAYYFLGLSFRLKGDNPANVNSYGLTFMRSKEGTGKDADGIPDSLLPNYNGSHYVDVPMIMLWGRDARGIAIPGDVWLAFMEIPESDTVLDQPSGGIERGEWVVSTSYAVDDVVTHNGVEYICSVAHTSTSGNNSNEPGIGKNWKDYWGSHEAIHLSDWATIVVRIVEAASIEYVGTTSIGPGDTVSQQASSGEVIRKIETDSGEILLLNNVNGEFQTGAAISGLTTVTVIEWRPKDNYIWAFYGDRGDQGTANDTPLDFANRRGNPRSGDIHWPVGYANDWAADKDHFTLVQWDSNLNTIADPEIMRLGKGKEENAILRTNIWLTPDDVYNDPPEIGVHALGTDIVNKTYFDNLAISLKSGGGERTVGFLPPAIVQQE